MSEEVLDLFGHPVVFAKPAERGRPEHRPTRENHNKILVMGAAGYKLKECARAIGITEPTLRKHYFSAVERFETSKLLIQGQRLMQLATEAADGNVAAIKELGKEIERGELRALGERVKDRGKGEKPAPPKGLKEQRKVAAQGVDGLFKPRQPPPSLQ